MHAHVTSSARCEACSRGLLVGRSPPQALEAGQPQPPAQMLVALDSGCCSTSVRASLWGQLSSSMIAAAVARDRGKR